MHQLQIRSITMPTEKNSNKTDNNMKKALSIVAALLFTLTAMAQNGYKISVQQVYPGGGTIFSKTFDYKRELDAAVSSQASSLRGRNANYVINIKTPNGSSSKSVQNITWVQSVNGSTSHHKGKTSPQGSYSSPTVWKGYSCNLYGKPAGNARTEEFIYRVQVDGEKEYRTQYVNKSSAISQAESIYKRLASPDKPVAVKVCKFSGGKSSVIKTITNQNDIQKNIMAQEQLDVENQENAISYFKDEMTKILLNIDSLKSKDLKRGVKLCSGILDSVSKILPEDVFIKENLDKLYLKVLTQNLLGETKNKQIKKVIEEFNHSIQNNPLANNQTDSALIAPIDSISSTIINIDNNKNSCYSRLKKLNMDIFDALSKEESKDKNGKGIKTENTESAKKTKDEDAYLKKVKNLTPSHKMENGILYDYYAINEDKNEWLRVNTDTKEYDTGVGRFNPDGSFKWKDENKVKHFSRDGKGKKGKKVESQNEKAPKQEKVKEDAYLKKVKGLNPQEEVEKGITYHYYEINENKNEWLRVNTETKEYDTGVGKFDSKGFFKWKDENKVKHYNKEGKEIKPQASPK